MPARVPSEKLRRAARLLLYRSRAKPGVRGWELAKLIGKDYLDVVRALNTVLDTLGLEVIAVDDEGRRLELNGDPRSALFLVVLKEPLTLQEARSVGWRVDDLAVLSASLLYLLAKGGKAPRGELVNVLKAKFRGPRLSYALDRLFRLGYLEEEDEQVKIGWRSRVEVSLDKLVGFSGLPSGGRASRESSESSPS